jgi:hypothetical protein
MDRLRGHLSAAIAAALLAACGSDSTTTAPAASTAHGTLAISPPLQLGVPLTAAALKTQLAGTATGAELLGLTGDPMCGVNFYYLEFWTVGAAGETTESSGALMVPTGAAPACSGPRPIVEYAHGTEFEKSFNIANVLDPSNSEGAIIAATYAAQGYIVVAPNYAGYDISTLGYHPYLNATQQSGEMIDALTAARTALPALATGTSDSGVLFLTGYSEGGHVAMATQRAMEAAGMKVTAASHGSGPYALEALGDVIFFGNVNVGSTLFTPLLTTSYQHAYGNIYNATTDIYSANFAAGIATLLPTTVDPYTDLFPNQLPQSALFDSSTPTVSIPNEPALSALLTSLLAEPSNPANPLTPLFQAGFGNPYLVNNSVRESWALDAANDPDGAANQTSASLAAQPPSYPLRKAFYLNDMRNGSWAPNSPTLLCGGFNDPTVFFSINAGTMAAFWSGLPEDLLTVLDIDPPAGPSGAFAQIQGAFQASQQAFYQAQISAGLSPAAAEQQVVENYHGSELPFCALAARVFFSQF